AERNRVEDRVEDVASPAALNALRGTAQGIEVAGSTRDQDRDGSHLVEKIEVCLVQAEEEIRTSPPAAKELLAIGRIDARCEARRLECRDRVLQMRKR